MSKVEKAGRIVGLAGAIAGAGEGIAHASNADVTKALTNEPPAHVQYYGGHDINKVETPQGTVTWDTQAQEQPATPGEEETKDLGILTPEGSGGTEETPPTQETPEIVATPGESETFQESYEYRPTDEWELTPTGANSDDETQNWKTTVTRDGVTYEFKMYESQEAQQDGLRLGEFGPEDSKGNVDYEVEFVGVETGTITYGDQNQFSAEMHYLIVAIPSEDGKQTLLVKFPRWDGSKMGYPNGGDAKPIPEAFEYFDRIRPGTIIEIRLNTKVFTKEDILKETNMPNEASCLRDETCARRFYLWNTENISMADSLIEWRKTGSEEDLEFDENGRAVVNLFFGIFR